MQEMSLYVYTCGSEQEGTRRTFNLGEHGFS